MPLFVCDNCGAIENTAFGFYWARKRVNFNDDELNGKALCSECVPEKFSDGPSTGFTGKWHGKWEKYYYDPKLDNREEFINK